MPLPPEIIDITNAISTVQIYIVVIATATAVVMITVAGFYIIVDRDVSVARRGERLAYIRSIVIGYVIVLGPNVLIAVVIHVLVPITGHPAPAPPNIPTTPVPFTPTPGS